MLLLLKSHRKEHLRHNKSGTVTIVRACDDSRQKHAIPPESEPAIIDAYKNGTKTIPTLAQEHEVGDGTIYRLLRRNGIKPVRGAKENHKAVALELLGQNRSQNEVAAQMGVNVRTIQEWVKEKGLTKPYNKASSDVQAEAVRLYAEHQMTIKQVARRLGVTPIVVHRAVKKSGVMRTASESRALATLRDMSRDSHRSQAYHWQSSLSGKWEPAGSIYELVRMKQLDHDDTVASWTKKVQTVPYGDGRTYIPDFYIEYKDGRKVVEEVKPIFKLKDKKNILKLAAAQPFFNNQGIEFRVVTEDELGRDNIKNFNIEGFAKITAEQRKERALQTKRDWHAENKDKRNAQKRAWRAKKAADLTPLHKAAFTIGDTMFLLRKSIAAHPATVRQSKKTGRLSPVKAFTERHVDAKPKVSSKLDKPVTAAKTAEIATRPDLMQFKHIENADGTNGQDAIKGKWNDLYAGVITVWKPEDPKAHGMKRGEKYIVVNGHHRLAHAKRFGAQNMRVQVLYEGKGPDKETSGYTALAARRVGAEINIVDGKGSIYDQVKFLRDQRAVVGKDRSLERAREIGISGGIAATIAFNAKDSLAAAFFNERITPQQTEQIANAAPGDEDLQRMGLKAAYSGKSGMPLYHYIMAVRAMQRDKTEEAQFDLFGNNDSAIVMAEQMAERAATIQRGIKERISAVAGAVNRPEKAKELGVNVMDLSATKKELDKLRAEKAKWDEWYRFPTLIAQVKLQPMVKGIGGKGMILLRKSHIQAHTRQLKSGRTVQVRDYDDKRSKHVEQNLEQARQWVAKGWRTGVDEDKILATLHKVYGIKGEAGQKLLDEHKQNKGFTSTSDKIKEIKTQLENLSPELLAKCRRAEPGKGGEIKLNKKEADEMLKKGTFGLISAGVNPADENDKKLTPKEVEARDEQLRSDLIAKGLKFVKVHGKYGEEEDSYMLLSPDMTRDEIKELGEKYNQDSVIYADHGKNEMLFTTGEHKGQRHEGSGFGVLPISTGDYFTEIALLKKKMKFSLHFDFDKFVKSLVKSLASSYMRFLGRV